MNGVTHLPAVPQRIETGPLKFGNDWTGIFIRGDEAHGFADRLVVALKALEGNDSRLREVGLIAVTELRLLLLSAREETVLEA